MAAFEDFMIKNYPYYKSAGAKSIVMWREIWNAAIKHAEALKPSHNSDYTAALENGLRDLRYNGYIDINQRSFKEAATRLNSAVKAQQNSA